MGLWEAVHRSKDPTNFAVLLEDSAALLGVTIAFMGILFSRIFEIPVLDGLASILIGLVLSAVAIVLAMESRSLLLGERTDLGTLHSIREIVESDPAVERMSNPLTMQVGPNLILLNLEIQFHSELTTMDIEMAVVRLEQNIRTKHPLIKRIFIEAARL